MESSNDKKSTLIQEMCGVIFQLSKLKTFFRLRPSLSIPALLHYSLMRKQWRNTRRYQHLFRECSNFGHNGLGISPIMGANQVVE